MHFKVKRARLGPFFIANVRLYGHFVREEVSVFEHQVQLQPFKVNGVFSLKPDIVDEIGKGSIEVLVDGIAALKDVTL